MSDFDAMVRVHPAWPIRTAPAAQIQALPWQGRIPVTQLLRFALPPYPSLTWREALARMLARQSEAVIVGRLAGELQMAGDFEEPVRVYFCDADDDEDAPAGTRTALPGLGNGMHRIAASLQVGAEYIAVTSTDWEDAPAPFAGQLIQVQYRLTGEPASSAGSHDDLFDYACGWLRSFRLTSRVWTETAALGSDDGIIDAIFHCPHQLQDDLVQALQARAAEHGLSWRTVSVRPVTWDLLEQEDEPAV